MNSLIKKACRYTFTIILFFTFVFFSGCTKEEKVIKSDLEKKTVIGFSMATLKEDRWLQDRDIFIAKAKKEGFEVIVKNANNDSQLQYKQVGDMVKSGIDILVIAPHDSIDSARCVNLAKKSGISVISYDRLVRNANVDVYVSFDNIKVGRVEAEELTKAVPEGGYVILGGAETDNNSKLLYSGYMSVLSTSLNRKRIKIVAETWVVDWRREGAFEFVSGILKENPDSVQGIIAANDSLAWGAIDAISMARLTGKIKVTGQDADLAACQRIVEGTQLSTVYKPIKKLVEETLNICKLLLNNEPVPFQSTINDGTYDIPYVMIDVISVNKDNIDDTIIKDGFHLKEDVYRNVQEQKGQQNERNSN